LLNGANYEIWLKYASLNESKIVLTSQNFKNQYIQIHGDSHSHANGELHSHSKLAFTSWLNFSLAAKQAEQIYQKLIELLPEQKNLIKKNYEKLQEELTALHKDMIKVGKNSIIKTLLLHIPYINIWLMLTI
jgi:zinc transport system substrate-binding protein